MNATAKGNGDIALGKHAVAQGGANGVTGSAALGDEAKATGAQSAAVGGKSTASGSHAVASGYNTHATGGSSSAIGDTAEASGNQSTAVGVSSEAKGNQSAALGMQAHAHGSGSVAAGVASQATQGGTTAIGGWTEAKAEKATAVGDSAHANANRATALGHDSQATGEYSTATGVSSRATGSSSVAIGHDSKAQANNTIAIGHGTKATNTAENSLVIGKGALVTAKDATVVGPVAQANGENATAVGRGAAANGTESTALGRGSVATGNQSIALGKGANAKVDSGVALGDDSVADRTARSQNGIVINTSDPSKSTGFNTENSVYAPVRLVDAPEALNLIKNTIKGNKGAVSVGDSGNTRQIINVAAGSADSDAVNVAQLKAVAGAIKHYDVTSPNGDITVTHPNPEDPNKTVWNLNLNPDRVKEITKWKLRNVDKDGNAKAGKTDALVKGDETVTFQDTDTIEVERVGTDGKTLQFHTKKNIKYFSVNSSGGGNENNDGATATDAIAIGKDAASSANNAVVIGKSATALKNNEQYDLNVGTATSNADSAVVIGNGATSKQARTVAIGNAATTLHTSAIAIGDKAYSNGARGIAIGRNAQSTGNNSIALGAGDQNDSSKTTASAEHAVAIGSAAVANIADGIALGSKSETTAASGQTGFDASTHDGRANHYDGLNGKTLTSNLAGLSIGNGNKTRQINHLAAGKEDDDAVNVAQLKSVNLAFKGDNNTKGDVRLHDQRLSVVGATDSFITTKANDNKLEINTTKSNELQFTAGAANNITTPTGLTTDKAVANAINNSGWTLQAGDKTVGLINPGDKVNIKAGTGVTITPTNETGGISTLTISAAQQNYSWKLKEDSQTPAQALNVTNNTAVSLKGENFLSITNKGGGNFVFKTTTENVGMNAATGATNQATATGLTTNKAVADAIAKSGFQLKENGTLKNVVNPGESLNFKPGQGTKVSVGENGDVQVNANVAGIKAGNNVTVAKDNDGVYTINAIDTNTQASVSKLNNNSPITIDSSTTNSAGAKDYKLDVNVDDTTITKTSGVLKAVTGNLNVNDNGNLSTPQKGSVLVNATTLTNVVNNTYWKAAAGGNHADGKTNLSADKITASSTVTFNAGKNLTVDHSVANNFTFALNKAVDLTKDGSLTIGETKVDNGGITITPTNLGEGKTAVKLTGEGLNNGGNKIVNVANGTNPTDAVNKSQLDDSISTESVVKADAEAGDTNIATITVADSKKTGDKGAKYQVGVSEKAVKEAARNAIDVTGTNFISATSNVAGDVETHTVTATTNAVTMNKAEGKANTPTATGLTTNKDVADAINASGWKISGKDTTASLVNPGNEVSFEGGEGTTVTVSNADGNGKRTVTIASTVKPNDKGVIEEVTENGAGENAPKKGQVKAHEGDGDKVTTVSNVANMINKAKWYAKAENGEDEVTDKTDDSNSDGQAMSAGDKLTLKAGKNLSVNRANGVFTFALNKAVDLTKDGSLTIGETKVDNGGITITPAGKSPVSLTANGLDNGNNKIVNVAKGTEDNDAVNVKQLKETELHIAPTKANSKDSGLTYTYDDKTKSVTLKYKDGNGNDIENTEAKIDLSGLASKIKDYSFKTNATGSNLVGTGKDTTVESGKSVDFAASDNLTLKQDVNDGNVTYTYGLKNQVVVGEKGTPGADGKPGKDGVDGSIGVNGKDGSAVAINGKDGSIGLNGKDGKNGLTIKGQDGKVGVDGKDGETRLVYVEKADPTKPGSSDKTHELATLDDGVKYAGDDAQPGDGQTEHQKDKVIAKKLNNIIDIIGGADKNKLSDKNIGVNNVDGKLKVQLAKELKGLTSAEFKDGDDKTKTEITHNGITITPVNPANGKTAVTLTDAGLNNGGNKITNVAEGENDTDAVNVKQLKTFKDEVAGYGWNLSVNNGKDASKITKDTTVDLNNDDGNIKIAKNGSNVTLSLGPDVGLGKTGKDGKDGSLAVRGKDGASVEISGKDGSIGLTGPKGKDGTPGASATITVEKGTTTVNNDRDGGKQVNRIVYTDKDKNGKDIKREVATLDDGLKFKGDSKEVINRTLGSQMNITGGADENKLTDKNIGVVYDKATNGLKVKLSKDVNLGDNGTITIGDTVVNKDGLTINGGPSVTKGGVNAGNQSVTNVKDGTADNDAVNVKQLKAAKTEVEAGDHIDVTSRVGANGQTIYKVSAKGINDTSAAVKAGSNHVEVTKAANTHKDGSTTVTDYTVDLSDETKNTIRDTHNKVTNEGLTFNADHGTTGVKKLGSKVAVKGDGKNITTTANENGVTVSMEDNIKVNSVTAKEVKVGDVNINENGINAGGKRITNVAPGKDGTDAVNVNQLKYVAGNISNQINNVDKGLRAGIAGALASGGLYHVTTAGKSMVSVGAGTYRGQNALAVGYSRLSDYGKVGVKFTVNSNSQGHAGASASVGYQW